MKTLKKRLVLSAMVVASACAVRPNVTLSARVANARTPSDHADVAAAYRKHAAELRTEAADHETLAKRFGSEAAGPAGSFEAGGGTKQYEDAAEHCRMLASYLSKAAAESDALAAAEDGLATEGASR